MRFKCFDLAVTAASIALTPVVLVGTPIQVAQAQAIVLSVNGDPITSVDVEQRMKLLRAERKPASRDAAIESMVSDRLRSREGGRFGIIIKDEEIGEQVQSDAKKLKMTPTQLLTDINKAGVSQEHSRNHFKAELAYVVLIKALNRGVEASEIQVRQEMERDKGKGALTSYTMRQVVFTLNPGDGPEVVNASAKQAEALRGKFTSCQSGIPYAKTLPGVAVRSPLVRSSTQLNDGIKEVLDKMPVGHLTPPSRSANGIELIALCERSASTDSEELRKTIAERILNDRMAQETEAKYKDLRSHAVIERH